MKRGTSLKAPYLKTISLVPERADGKRFPFNRLKFLTDAFEMTLCSTTLCADRREKTMPSPLPSITLRAM